MNRETTSPSDSADGAVEAAGSISWDGRATSGGRRAVQFAKRARNAIVKSVKNPVTAWRMLAPRYSPFFRKSPDTEFRRMVRWSFGGLKREPISSVFPGIERVDVELVRGFDREPLLSMTASEVLAIAAMVRHLKPMRLLEIGTFEGNTTVNMAANAPAESMVFTLDLPPDWNERYALEVPSIHYNAATGHHTGTQFTNSRHADRITQLWGDSAEFDWSRHGPFDFILIDGCHTYEYAVSDTRNALRVVRPGGTIVWHDYGMLEDVSRAVDEAASRMTVRAIQGTRLAVGSV